ncbi:hypothetical protein HDU79_006932 [Rhizoclosmatium sp. JEL0117]|nr:hypothetical protein HDU79_006932 [Rhizoclosmatium sp. JEL0117]
MSDFANFNLEATVANYTSHTPVPFSRLLKGDTLSPTVSDPSKLLLTYNGGPVISNVEITTIWFDSTAQFQSDLVDFYNFVASSDYMNIFLQYTTPTQSIGRGSVVGQYAETRPIKTSLDDVVDIQPYLRELYTTGKINPNQNSYYAIHLAYGINVTMQGGQSCVEFGGYHNAVLVGDISNTLDFIYYGVIPQCYEIPTVNYLLDATSHELAEAISDPIPGHGWYNNVPGPLTGEIGDICVQQGTFLTDSNGRKWEAQKMWSNIDQTCTVGKSSSPQVTTVAPLDPQYVTYTDGALILQNVEVTPIFYGPDVAFATEIVSYYKTLVKSHYMDLLSEYNTSNPPQTIGYGTVNDPYFETNPVPNLEYNSTLASYLRRLAFASQQMVNAITNEYFAWNNPDLDVGTVSGMSCVGIQTPLEGGFVVQKIWSNKLQKCVGPNIL